ncbi:Glycosyl transferase family 2 [Porphyromonadaceae bacterium KH3CP3RA]|nr:Glycosyl transferase family 2 [Porphyromonadaceae bacterium KH3CP3RA]
MSLAIVIPYYNIDFFDKTLFSLACQTDKRFKVYIGNNNSPNNPIKLIDNYRNQLDIVYKEFKNERNPITLSEQFMQCVSLISDEEWFMILGDDDLLEQNVIADFYRYLPQIEENRINVVKYSTAVINKNDDLSSKIYKYNTIENSTDLYVKKINKRARSSLSEHIFRTSQYHQYRISAYPLAWHSDDMMVLKYSNFGNIFCISDSIVLIRSSNMNITGRVYSYMNEKSEASIYFFSELLSRYTNKFDYNDLKNFFQILITMSLDRYNPSGFLEHIRIGVNILGEKEVDEEIIGIKYPQLINIETDRLEKSSYDFYINTFCLYKNKENVLREFSDKKEFNIEWIELGHQLYCIDKEHLNSIVNKSLMEEDDFIIVCFENHRFGANYIRTNLLKYIYWANIYKADILFGNGDEIDFMCKLQEELYWVNSVRRSNFIILFRNFFRRLWNLDFSDNIDLSEKISTLSTNKLIIHPFI